MNVSISNKVTLPYPLTPLNTQKISPLLNKVLYKELSSEDYEEINDKLLEMLGWQLEIVSQTSLGIIDSNTKEHIGFLSQPWNPQTDTGLIFRKILPYIKKKFNPYVTNKTDFLLMFMDYYSNKFNRANAKYFNENLDSILYRYCAFFAIEEIFKLKIN